MGTRGQPKITEFIEYCIAFKVMQYAKRYNETHYKAWFRLTKHRAFKDLMRVNYKNFKIHNPWLLENHLNNKSRKSYTISIPSE